MRYYCFLAFAVMVDASIIDQIVSKEFAQVKVERIARRSLDEAPAFRVHISGLGDAVALNLRSPSESIFSPNFKYHEATTDAETGEFRMIDATPTAEELHEIEKNFFTDVEANAALSMKRSLNSDTYHFNGRIDDVTIKTQGDNLHELVRKTSRSQPRMNDYINLDRKIEPSKNSRAVSRARPEVFVVWDYDASAQFDFNRNRILDYIGVFFHGVNNRYATAQDPIISFRISGVTAVNRRSAQPYMENNAVSGGGYDIDKVLNDFAYWLYQNDRSAPRYDVSALISNTDMKMKDSNGQWSSGVAGLAYMSAACLNDTWRGRYLGSSVTEDLEGYFDGVFSVAHELAHNLGSPHDGDPGAEDCPWSQGYLMSYEGWGTKNKFYFSPCSLNLMKNYIDSNEGRCTKTDQSTSEIPISNDNTGDRFDMTAMCRKKTGQSNAVPDPDTDPNQLCKNLKCRYPTPGKPAGWYSIMTLNQPPRDNASCGNGGKCKDGDCVGQS